MAVQKNFLKRQESVKEEPELHEMSVYFEGKDAKQGSKVLPPSLVINDVDDDTMLLTDVSHSEFGLQDLKCLGNKKRSPDGSPSKFGIKKKYDSAAFCIEDDILNPKKSVNSPKKSVTLKQLQETMKTKDSITSIGKASLVSDLSRQSSRRSELSTDSRRSSRKPSCDETSKVESLKRHSFDNESYILNLDDSMEVSSVVSTPRQRSLDYSFNNGGPPTPRTFRPTASPVPHPYLQKPPPRTSRTMEERFRDELRNCIVEQSDQITANSQVKEQSLCDYKVVLVICTITGGLFIILGAVLFALSHQSTLKFHGGTEPGKALLVIGFLLIGGVALVLFMHYRGGSSNDEGNQENTEETGTSAPSTSG